MNDFQVVVPARFKSSRFPGKPLAMIAGKSLVSRVWEKCCQAVGKNKVLVATDDNRIYDHCINHNINVMMTKGCLTGTDRIYEISHKIDAKHFIGVQGDEPLVVPEDILKIIEKQDKFPDSVICGMCKINNESDFNNYSVPKVITSADLKCLYMSRAPIPACKEKRLRVAWRQVCIHSYPVKLLRNFGKLGKKSHLENIEDIEDLRFIEMGIEIQMVKVSPSIAVDHSEDIVLVEKCLG